MSVTSPRAELARAIRDLNARYHRLPPDQRPAVSWGERDEQLEAALVSGDRERALAEVTRWHDAHLVAFEEARIGHVAEATPEQEVCAQQALDKFPEMAQ